VRELADAAEGERSQVLLSSHSPFVIVDAWNGDARDFIYQCHPSEGLAKVSKFTAIVHDAGALTRGGGLGLRLAEEVMDGFRHQAVKGVVPTRPYGGPAWRQFSLAGIRPMMSGVTVNGCSPGRRGRSVQPTKQRVLITDGDYAGPRVRPAPTAGPGTSGASVAELVDAGDAVGADCFSMVLGGVSSYACS